ncbi:GAF domain-containing protein [Streptomyces sp. NBC_01142]|uniref:helix-turn-helix domain-containing protein n=1 Tax=Streptomyces sp. NBC_01142 TaxID=2975865 RepID=UPI00225B099C|nr:helix-turn-helix domain-containing protein [Streptomyces sp. NBC_01142]MCX4820071.1 GAF domain-containing protein [Streptomyces sp. NBC_01142]
MQNTSLDMARLAAMDSAEATRLLKGVRDATLAGRHSRLAPRADISESWQRMLRGGVDPDRDRRAGLLPLEELERRRLASPLREVLPVLREGLVSVAEAAHHIMVVADTEGRLLWREGSAAVLRKGDSHGFVPGADWNESLVGTNGVGTPLVSGRPVQVHSAEHFVATHHTWTCAGAPITDPRDGRLIGVVDISGPLSTMHPATLSLVTSVGRLAEAELRNRHFEALDRLRCVASPLLARVGGRALALDGNGWPAAVTGMPPTGRLRLPKSVRGGRLWLPSLGMCAIEPLPGGWLVRVDDEQVAAVPGRVVLDLSRPRRPSVTVSGTAGSWAQELSPRHAELLFVLALHRDGRSAAQLAQEIFEDRTRTVTVRAEMSRLRRHLAHVLAHRPYRFVEEVEVEVIRPEHPAGLLPHSTAPAVVSARTDRG